MFTLHHGNCLEILPTLEDQSVDMVFCDLPYGTTYAKWDSIIPAATLWEQYRRIVKPTGAIVLTASQPFTSALVVSNPDEFRCEWIWDKVNAANFANAKRQPLKVHESVLVFSQKPCSYYPIKVPGKPNHVQGNNSNARNCETQRISERAADDLSGMKYPKTIQTFPKHSSQSKFHPTQKPVDLCSYFIRTYSLEGEVVLDNCMGSGSTGVSCGETGRRFIGIEMDERYFKTATERISAAYPAQDPADGEADE